MNGLCPVALAPAGLEPVPCPGPAPPPGAADLPFGFLVVGSLAPALVEGRGDGSGGGRPEPALVEGRGDGRGCGGPARGLGLEVPGCDRSLLLQLWRCRKGACTWLGVPTEDQKKPPKKYRRKKRRG